MGRCHVLNLKLCRENCGQNVTNCDFEGTDAQVVNEIVSISTSMSLDINGIDIQEIAEDQEELMMEKLNSSISSRSHLRSSPPRIRKTGMPVLM